MDDDKAPVSADGNAEDDLRSISHLAETVSNDLAHTSRHAEAAVDSAKADDPESAAFNAEHAQSHIASAQEHAEKLVEHIQDHPELAKELAALEGEDVSKS